ncbi:MAG TPA: hypothetical protein VN704_01895, partial [Verrucomicrobiae bacterium]|nr:hypothetical protein [Verrucomicrobiae bacterium]
MKIFTREKITVFLLFLLVVPIFIMFVFHDIYIGTDEIRTTYVSKEIADRGDVYFKDPNNTLYNTNIFLKNAFLINSDKVIYPAGFTINSLILVPILAVAPDPVTVFNLFSLICYILSFLIIYKVFYILGLNKYKSMVGAIIFSLTNFYLAMYVSYYPDFLLTLFFLTFIYMIICFQKTSIKIYFYLSLLISAFLLAYKITMYPIMFTFLPIYFIYLYKKKRMSFKPLVYSTGVFLLFFLLFNIPQLITNKIGPTYNELSTSTDVTQSISQKNTIQTKTSSFSRVEHLAGVFYTNFLLPKGNGIYLEEHFVKDFLFLSDNNIIFIFGFLLSTIYLYKHNKKHIL